MKPGGGTYGQVFDVCRMDVALAALLAELNVFSVKDEKGGQRCASSIALHTNISSTGIKKT